MSLRDRIQELRHVKASDLQPHPLNWRKHPGEQRAALQTVLDEIGFADAVIARETPGGLQLIDGHLRADILGDELVPVLVTDLSDDEAALLLAVYDPLSAMAVPDEQARAALRSGIDSEAMQALLDQMDTRVAMQYDGMGADLSASLVVCECSKCGDRHAKSS